MVSTMWREQRIWLLGTLVLGPELGSSGFW
jgi:hypothetical protein